MKKVFLSHRFDFLDAEQVDATAKAFTTLLAGIDVKVVSMSTEILEERNRPLDKEAVRNIVEADLRELEKADILLLDVSLEGWNYIGVTCEMVYAFKWGKPIIAYVGNTKNGERMWLRYHANEVCRSLDEVKNAVNNYVA